MRVRWGARGIGNEEMGKGGGKGWLGHFSEGNDVKFSFYYFY